jgi:small-conductance mechanosensitive channel
MDFVLLGQQVPIVGEPAKRLLQKWFEHEPPYISIPVYIVGVVALAWLVEKSIVALLRHMSRKTVTQVDDAFADGLPMIVRPLFAVMALHVVVQQLLRETDEKGGSRLSADGELATKALTFLSILVFAFSITRLFSRMIDAWVSAEPGRMPVGPPVKLGLKVVMVPVALLAALEAIGYPAASLLAAFGIGGLAVGLALQDTLKNMFAGIQIVLDRPIRAGDFVEVDKNARGTVVEIGLRSTKLRSVDNNTIIIPNSTIANAMVTNFDVQDRSYIETFLLSVAYGSDTRRVQALLEEVAAAAQTELSASITEEPIKAIVRGLGDSSVDFSVPVKFRQFAGRAAMVSELYHRFYERLRSEGIEIPYPTRTVHLRDERAPVSASPAS